jgi:hypothetical protein
MGLRGLKSDFDHRTAEFHRLVGHERDRRRQKWHPQQIAADQELEPTRLDSAKRSAEGA